jgi:two-component system NarL family sensor kinase
VTVALSRRGGRARLVVTDDGVGLGPDSGEGAVRRGHIGLASHAVRVEAAGGRLRTGPGEPSGTVATVELPLPG